MIRKKIWHRLQDNKKLYLFYFDSAQSSLQPFEDGNKRTGRLMANALLLAHRCAPLSYRSVDENDYREALLVFYELNSVIPFKKIFIAQYEFAAKNYLV